MRQTNSRLGRQRNEVASGALLAPMNDALG
jgi:hypothetical protein